MYVKANEALTSTRWDSVRGSCASPFAIKMDSTTWCRLIMSKNTARTWWNTCDGTPRVASTTRRSSKRMGTSWVGGAVPTPPSLLAVAESTRDPRFLQFVLVPVVAALLP